MKQKAPSFNGVFLCSGGGTRTPDKVVNSHLLYQLSYSGFYIIVILSFKNPAEFIREITWIILLITFLFLLPIFVLKQIIRD